MAGSILVVISDTHIGSNTALSPLTFTAHNRNTLEEQVVHANTLQRWLNECWRDFWDYVYSLQGKGKNKRRLIVVHCGDIIDGNHHQTTQIVQEVADQARIAIELLEPIAYKANAFFGIFGTAAHAGIDVTTEADIYRQLNAQEVGQQLTLSIDGVLHDFAHHGRAGRRPWTSAAANLGTEVIVDYAQSGKMPPNYVWRGHNHVIDDSGSKLPGTRVLSLPSWQLKTTFGWRASANTVRSDIGGMIVVDGLLDDSRARYKGQPDGRKVVTV